MFSPPPFHPDRPGLVTPVRVDEDGLTGPARREARRAAWRRSSHGLYVPTHVERTPPQRILEAVAGLGPVAAVTGWAALCWLGARWFQGTGRDGLEPLDVPLAGNHFIRPRPGVVVSQEFLHPAEVVVIDGLPITRPVRSAAFEARRARTLDAAVRALDMAAYDDLVSLREVQAYAEALGPWTGIGQLRAALAEADENAWSPTEVSMRRIWEAATGVRPLTNVPIFDRDGHHLATTDLLDPEAGVVGEYEGAVHLVGRRAGDVRREGVLRHHELSMVTMVSADLTDPSGLLVRLEDAYRDAARRRTGRRTWTIEPPHWWKPTLTVAQRRALTESDRERLLAHRRAA